MSDSYSYQGPPMDAAMSGAGNTDPYKIYRDGIAAIESRGSGDYNAVGPVTKSGDRAYGRYQIMGNNIPEWTQNALGKSMSAKEFQADPKAQDAVFNHQFGNYLTKYGNGNDAISAWFSGQPLAQALNKSDGYMKTARYVDNVNRAMSGLKTMPAGTPYNEATASNDPDEPSQNSAPVSQQGQPNQNGFAVPGQESQGGSFWDRLKSGGPSAALGLSNDSYQPWTLGSALQNMGIAAMARDNPAGAAAMAQVPSMEARAYQRPYSMAGYNQASGKAVVFNNRTGGFNQVQAGTPFYQAPEAQVSDFDKANEHINTADNALTQLKNVRDMVQNGQLDPGILSRGESYINGLQGSANKNDLAIYNAVHNISIAHNNLLQQHTGTQTDKDSEEAFKTIMPGNAQYDKGAFVQAINNVLRAEGATMASNIQAQTRRLGVYGHQLTGGDESYADRYAKTGSKWNDVVNNDIPQSNAWAEKNAQVNAEKTAAPAAPAPKYSGGGSDAASSGGSLKTMSPADAAKMPSGYRFKGTDGKTYEVH